MEHLKKTGYLVLMVMIGIVATGLLLDEANKGTFGAMIKGLAKKSTSGYGSLTA